MVMFNVTRKETAPIDGQKPGTSGLRKKVYSFDWFLIIDFVSDLSLFSMISEINLLI